jgi:hypothetical protein
MPPCGSSASLADGNKSKPLQCKIHVVVFELNLPSEVWSIAV